MRKRWGIEAGGRGVQSSSVFATPIARASVAMLLILAGAAALVPEIAGTDPRAIGDVLGLRFVAPGGTDAAGNWHLLGTDRFGRDIFVRMMLAARLSLIVGLAGSTLAGAMGISLGALAGWYGGIVDRLLMALSDALLAIPRLVLLLVCAALWQPGAWMVV
ncbi:MAG: hypothetical protein H0W30_00750, partial [Gemmatimonadaceae bacterium]|nr:hypothetical protein [Gemmatimonadaceae bacterium]